MTKQVEGVYERVLACAKEEFLEKGFSKSSLRTIAAKADTTTGTIYSRFGGKEGLFSAIVEPVSDRIIKMFLETQESFHALDAKEQPSMFESMFEVVRHKMPKEKALKYMMMLEKFYYGGWDTIMKFGNSVEK